jgi:hypothetical protein
VTGFDGQAYVRGLMRNLKVTGDVHVPWSERSKLPEEGEAPFVMQNEASVFVTVHVLGRNGEDYARGDDEDPSQEPDEFSFPWGATVGKVPCIECLGTGWWGYGPTPNEQGPCIQCKGDGRVWVGLL